MTDKLHIRVPRGKRIFEVLEEHRKYKRPQLSEEEKARHNAQKKAFSAVDGSVITANALLDTGFSEILIGLPWLETRRMVLDKKANLL